MVKKWRKKPLIAEAIQWTGLNLSDVCKFVGIDLRASSTSDKDFGFDEIEIETLEGTMKAQRGDYVIKGVAGEFYPCKPGIFESSYELVEV